MIVSKSYLYLKGQHADGHFEVLTPPDVLYGVAELLLTAKKEARNGFKKFVLYNGQDVPLFTFVPGEVWEDLK